jgi:hypothetical protein
MLDEITSTNLSSPFPLLYRDLNGDNAKQTGDQPPEGRCTFPALRKDPQRTVMSVITVMLRRKALT